jgi:hypothetical protein
LTIKEVITLSADQIPWNPTQQEEATPGLPDSAIIQIHDREQEQTVLLIVVEMNKKVLKDQAERSIAENTIQ